MWWTTVDTPVGALAVGLVDAAVGGVAFEHRGQPAHPESPGPPAWPALAAAVRTQLAEYFAGERIAFDLPTTLRRGSPFERAVWGEIAAIPYGETVSYGAIARAVGEPGGAQAVGLACNRNPLPVLVACHRVIGSDGRLVGFGGGIARKRQLLSLEARIHIERTFAP